MGLEGLDILLLAFKDCRREVAGYKSRTLSQWAIASRSCGIASGSRRRSHSKISGTVQIAEFETRQTVEKQEALDHPVGVLHLADRLVVFMGAELRTGGRRC